MESWTTYENETFTTMQELDTIESLLWEPKAVRI